MTRSLHLLCFTFLLITHYCLLIFSLTINYDYDFLESKASHSSDDAEDQIAMQDWKGGGGDLQILQSPKASAAPQMANIGKVKFQPPNVPVIFILGGKRSRCLYF